MAQPGQRIQITFLLLQPPTPPPEHHTRARMGRRAKALRVLRSGLSLVRPSSTAGKPMLRDIPTAAWVAAPQGMPAAEGRTATQRPMMRTPVAAAARTEELAVRVETPGIQTSRMVDSEAR